MASNFLKMMERIQRSSHEALVNGVEAATQQIVTDVNEVVPVESGELKDSAKSETEEQDSTITGHVTYNTDYAIFVHERPGEGYKFLQDTAVQNRSKYLKTIAKALSEAIRG